MTIKKLIYIIIFIVVIISILGFFNNKNKIPGKLDSFAQCISDSGAKFYGAFWCPHCNDQKKAFGSSVKYLPYIECSSLDTKSQLQICKDNKIEGYPTWEFKDGSRLSGEVQLKTLADKTNCKLSQ